MEISLKAVMVVQKKDFKEARGLDAGPRLVQKLIGFGDRKTSNVVAKIAEEEVAHVAVGVYWFVAVCQQMGRAPCPTFRAILGDPASDPNHPGVLGPPLSAREEAGLPQEWYDPLKGSTSNKEQLSKAMEVGVDQVKRKQRWVASWFGVAMVMVVPWKTLEWVWFKPKRIEKYLRQQGLQGTSYKPLFGDTKEIMSTTKLQPMSLSDDIMPRVMPFVHTAIQAYGKIFFAWFGPVPTVHVVDPDVVRDILSRMNEFQKPRKNNPYVKILSTGIIDYEGDKWSKHRKIINPTFHAEKLKLMAPAMCLSCCEMIKRWEKLFSNEQSLELDVFPHLQKLTGDVISRTAFGSSYEEGVRIFDLQNELGSILMHAIQSLYIPGSRFFPSARNKRMEEIDHEVKALIRSMIDNRTIAMEAGETSHDDLLGILLQSNYNEVQKTGNKRFGMSIDEIIEECKLFYFAGHETVGNLLVWTMVLLSRYPQWQELARDEVFHVFGNNNPDLDGLSRLKTVNMILLEVLRLYPGVSALYRMCTKESKVAGINLPEGTLVIMPILALHHDHETWGDDAVEFNPQRFCHGVSKATSGGQVSYFPFGGGPRICIGQNFAMLEAKIVMVMILQRFSFVLSPSYSHAPQSIITLQPQYGAHLILQKVKPTQIVSLTQE